MPSSSTNAKWNIDWNHPKLKDRDGLILLYKMANEQGQPDIAREAMQRAAELDKKTAPYRPGLPWEGGIGLGKPWNIVDTVKPSAPVAPRPNINAQIHAQAMATPPVTANNEAADILAEFRALLAKSQEPIGPSATQQGGDMWAGWSSPPPKSAGGVQYYQPQPTQDKWIVDQRLPVFGGQTGAGSGWTNSFGLGGRTTADITADPRYKEYIMKYGNVGEPPKGFKFAPKGQSSWGSSEIGYGKSISERTQTRNTIRERKIQAAQDILDKAIPGAALTSAQRTAFDIIKTEQGNFAADIQAQSMMAKLQSQWDKRINEEKNQKRKDELLILKRQAEERAGKTYNLKAEQVANAQSSVQAVQDRVGAFNTSLKGQSKEVQAEGAKLTNAVRLGLDPTVATNAAIATADAKAESDKWKMETKPAIDAQINSEKTIEGKRNKLQWAIQQAENARGMAERRSSEIKLGAIKPDGTINELLIDKDALSKSDLDYASADESVSYWQKQLNELNGTVPQTQKTGFRTKEDLKAALSAKQIDLNTALSIAKENGWE